MHGYADHKSVAAGELLRFHVSSDRAYRLSVCRLGSDVEGRSDDQVLHRFAPSPARVQPIHPGSYVHVDKGLPAALPLRGLTVECWVKPWRIDTRQSLVGQYDFPAHCGWGLFIEEGGALGFHLGDGGAFRADALQARGRLVARRWQHVAATWNGRVAALWIDGVQAGQWEAAQEAAARRRRRCAWAPAPSTAWPICFSTPTS